MARLKEPQKKNLIADIETCQYSVRELAKKYNVSNATIQKYKDEITHPESEHIVNAGIAYKMGLSEIQEPEKVNAIVNAVDEKTRHLIFFQNSALKNQQQTNKLLDDGLKEKGIKIYQKQSLLKDHATITKMNKETVLGKDPDTIINNANNQQNNTQIKTIDDIYAEV